MAAVRKIIILNDQQGAWIKAQIDAGRYASDSECVRDLIRGEQARSAGVEAIRLALNEGESSGEPRLFSADEFKGRMLKAHG
ncbi:hypothetical protein PS3A_40540 [Pseudomonas sp. 3A(2025)]